MSATENKKPDASADLNSAASGKAPSQPQPLGSGDKREAQARGLTPEVFRKAYDFKTMG